MDTKKLNEFIKKHKREIIIGSTIVVTLTATSLTVTSKTHKYEYAPFDGVLIDNLNVGGLKPSELKEVISKLLDENFNNKKIIFTLDDKKLEVTPFELGISYNIDEIIEQAITYKKSGNVVADTISRIGLSIMPENLNYRSDFNKDKLEKFLEKKKKKFTTPAKNSKVTFKEKTISLGESKNGTGVDKKALKKKLTQLIKNGLKENNVIEIPTKTLEPALTKDLEDKLSIIGSYKTKLPSLNSDRTDNIRLFSSKINGSIVPPGEEFSADKTAGSREKSDGYKAAKAFESGKVVDAVAGGICQSVSTLYNALLYADMEITQRAPHSMSVTYVSNGLDAAIAKGYKDLKFINNTSKPVIIQLYVSNDGYVVANLWGVQENPNKKIKLRVNHHGPKATTSYKDTYEDNKLIKSEVLSRDTYK